ncbi:hypothetical protein PUR28_27875 [Streptomyces sp. BE308]|uniref:hypothetical protein n=1 Tax=Streptomyces sp. BE308 TaxID=3002529 RepID=UPI002E76AA5F|nr:hypothetical protein [Streptomyces sp. BE308]MEE1794547.1 hypothetical protein [Streptomyces sp. BE308]
MPIAPPPAPPAPLTDAFFTTWKDEYDTTYRRAYFLTTNGLVSYADLSTTGTWEGGGNPLPIAKFWKAYALLGTHPAAAAVVVNGLPWFITDDHTVLKPHENATAQTWATKPPTPAQLDALFTPVTPQARSATACLELSEGDKAVVFSDNGTTYTLANLQTSTDPSPKPQRLPFTVNAALAVRLDQEEAAYLLDGTTWRHTTPNLHKDPETGGPDWSKFSLDLT